MQSRQRRRMYFVYVATVLLLLSAGSGYADPTWGRTFWEDDFEDGNYTSDPTWAVFSSPGGARSVVTYEGDYAFELTAPYLAAAGGGWSGAYVDLVQGDQGIAGWLDTSPLQSDDWAAVYTLRYSPPTLGFGTGYALAVLHDSADAIYAELYQFNDTTYASVAGPVQVASSYQDVWVRFLAMGTGTDTELLGRVWADGQSEPDTWSLRGNTASGITSYYNTGRGGVAVLATTEGVTADAYFDDIKFGTPEPATLALVLAGIGVLAARKRRQN